MQTDRAETRSVRGPAGGGRFLWRGLALFMCIAPALGLATAWVAVVAQGYFAPLVIFPLLVGICLGALFVGLMRLSQVGNRPTVLLATLLAVGLTVACQHYVAYRAAREQLLKAAGNREAARLRLPKQAQGIVPETPVSFANFMRGEAARGRPLLAGYTARGWAAWVSWAADGLLVLAAAMAMVVPAVRLPYCNSCLSWYRVIRSGRIGVPAARQLAELARLPTVEQPTAARYRVLSCSGGCGPTDLVLSWQQSGGGSSPARAFIDSACRNRVMQLLDEAQAADSIQ